MFDIAILIRAFPTSNRCAFCGTIPIEVFNAIEREFRAYMRANNLRAIYRGPRNRHPTLSGYETWTRRSNATGVTFYLKSY